MRKYLFDITVYGQLGLRSGKLYLENQDGVLSGELTLLGKQYNVSGGTATGDRFAFEVNLQTATGDLPCNMIGYLKGGSLFGGMVTPKGCWELKGTQRLHRWNDKSDNSLQ